MKRTALVFGILLIFFQLNSFSQNRFPESWEGTYVGELQIFGVDSVKMKLTMKLDIAKETDSIYQWKIVYDYNGKEDIRDYELILVDQRNGVYKIDEKNTIIIDSYYKMGNFISFFEVRDALIIATYTKIEDGLLFELTAGNSKNPSITGGLKYESEDIPQVKSFMVNGRQKAILIKQ